MKMVSNNFCNELNAAYNVQSRRTMANYVDLMYSDEKYVLVKSLESRSGISLPTDV